MEEVSRKDQIKNRLCPNGLFIIGHARSGTTVLQSALNSSPDIFLFGEANLHMNVGNPNFTGWYNSMHRSFGNVLSKSTTCPELTEPEANGWDVLLQLRSHYKYVGDKIAFRTKALGYDMDKSYRFLHSHFGRSRYVCLLRNPTNVLASNQRLFAPENIDEYAISYLESVAHIMAVHQTFDFVTVLIFEDISARSFQVLSERLDCSLERAPSYYSEAMQKKTYPAPDKLTKAALEKCDYYYRGLRELFANKSHACSSLIALTELQHQLQTELASLSKGIRN